MAVPAITGNTSTITRERGRIIKRVERYLEFGIFERGMQFLTLLKQSGFVPQLYGIRFNEMTLEMEDCGPDLTVAKPPKDGEAQAVRILRWLQDLGIRHNDIRPENVTVKDGKLYLIDWQWATRYGLPPTDWPKGLGGKFRAGWPSWQFDDAVSLGAVLGI